MILSRGYFLQLRNQDLLTGKVCPMISKVGNDLFKIPIQKIWILKLDNVKRTTIISLIEYKFSSIKNLNIYHQRV